MTISDIGPNGGSIPSHRYRRFDYLGRMDETLTVEQAAEILNVRPEHVRDRMESGDLPSLLRSDVLVYLRFARAASELAMLQMVREAEESGLYDLVDEEDCL